MIVWQLAIKSLRNRWLTALLTVLAIAVSTALFLGVEKVRTGARQSFADTISGTDLIVGARTGSIQLLLYTVFRIGNATNNITWASYQDIAAHPDVAWTVPLSLGDSHRGFRVLGTTPEYFERYKFRGSQALRFKSGTAFADLFDTVLGADVAQALGYRLGDPIVLAHGLGSVSFVEHGDKPFRVAGILEKTGTPVDRTVHVSLAAIEAIHVDWQNGSPVPGQSLSADDVRKLDLKPQAITAAFAAGAVTHGLFPVDVAIFATIVFIAGMGIAFGRIAVGRDQRRAGVGERVLLVGRDAFGVTGDDLAHGDAGEVALHRRIAGHAHEARRHHTFEHPVAVGLGGVLRAPDVLRLLR